MCHVHCDISLLILLTHRWLHKSLVTEKSVISPSRSYLFKFFLNFWKDLYFFTYCYDNHSVNDDNNDNSKHSNSIRISKKIQEMRLLAHVI